MPNTRSLDWHSIPVRAGSGLGSTEKVPIKSAHQLPKATGAVGVAALAYVTDYHLIPRRFTPGFELSLSRHSFPWLYAALAAGLFIPYLNNVKGHKAEAFADHCEYPGRTKKAEDRSNVERKRTD
jgi:hypothetical protein